MLFQEGLARHCEEYAFCHRLGTTFPVECGVVPTEAHSPGMCAVVTFRDITLRQALHRQLVQSQKLESIGQLAAGIAHEINTPIQYVNDNVQFLRDSFAELSELMRQTGELLRTPGARAEELLERYQQLSAAADMEFLTAEVPAAIRQSIEGIERVATIVRAMKEFSYPGEATRSPVDLNRAIESSVTVARNEWKYVADVETRFDHALPMVPCLANEVNQVIVNLLVNAAHAIADVVGDGANGKGKIVITTSCDDSWAELRISDTGAGIPEEIRSRIFDPFFTTKKVGKGTGQGLALAHAIIVEKHDGEIFFESAAGRGTTFIVRLPLHPDVEGGAP
jgi:signal transduction histidine kinase